MTQQLFLNQAGGSPVNMSLASKIVDASGGTLGTSKTNWLGGSAGWRELYSGGDAGNSPGLANPGPPSKHGWLYEGSFLNNALVPTGNWDDVIALFYSGGVAIVVDVLHRYYRYQLSDDSFTWLGEQLYSSLSVAPGTHQYSQTGLAQIEQRFPTGTYLYEDCWVKTSAIIPNSLAVGQGNTASLGSTTGSFTTIPSPLQLAYNVDLVNISGYQHKPKHEYPDKSYILSISEDSGVKIGHGGKTVVFSQAIQPVSDAYFQMTAGQDQFGRIRYPHMIVYRRNSVGSCDMLLSANDGAVYQVPAYQMVDVRERGYGSPNAVVAIQGDEYHVFDLHAWSVMTR